MSARAVGVVLIVLVATAMPATPASPSGSSASTAATLTGTIFFTSFAGCARGLSANVYKASFAYVAGSEFTVGTPQGVTCTGDSADGLIFAPDGDLLVGGKGNGLHKVDPRTGAFSTIKTPVDAFHLMLDPSGTKVWVSGIPGQPASIPLSPGGKGAAHAFVGDDTQITSIAWDSAGRAYYTSSGAGGGGSFGSVDFGTFTTKRIMSSLPAAHGMVFDPYTGDLVLMGANNITQISVGAAPKVVSDLSLPGEGNFDQGTVDGKGHLFAASHQGRMLFVDYSASRKVANPGNYKVLRRLVDALDDIAPLVGPGAAPVPAAGPKPAPGPGVPQVMEEAGKIRIVLESAILFDFDKDNLKPQAQAVLADLKASIIDKHPGTRVIVEGYTDDRGAQAYNLMLSQRRAQSVADWLKGHGVAASRLETKGYGKLKPRYPNTTEENRARNRRVEIVVVK